LRAQDFTEYGDLVYAKYFRHNEARAARTAARARRDATLDTRAEPYFAARKALRCAALSCAPRSTAAAPHTHTHALAALRVLSSCSSCAAQKNGNFKAGIKAMIRCAAAALSTHELKARAPRGARTRSSCCVRRASGS
jgi:hypothetical protein